MSIMLINTILHQHIIFHSAHHSPPVPSGVTGGEGTAQEVRVTVQEVRMTVQEVRVTVQEVRMTVQEVRVTVQEVRMTFRR